MLKVASIALCFFVVAAWADVITPPRCGSEQEWGKDYTMDPGNGAIVQLSVSEQYYNPPFQLTADHDYTVIMILTPNNTMTSPRLRYWAQKVNWAGNPVGEFEIANLAIDRDFVEGEMNFYYNVFRVPDQGGFAPVNLKLYSRLYDADNDVTEVCWWAEAMLQKNWNATTTAAPPPTTTSGPVEETIIPEAHVRLVHRH